ncbi:hypothetical protein [Haloarchaeobius sp. DFWS5]|uniref:hypothetical protein n=1 Tax=Haloarchaeobius sp. DFWS5 TaxID=3446114 RepID=UPI003EBCDA99
MAATADLISHHITVLRRCGLSDEEICEVYGVTDPPDDAAVAALVGETFDDDVSPRTLYDRTHRALSVSSRGIDTPRDYPDRVVPQQLDTVFGAYDFSMYFVDDTGEPIESGVDPRQPFRIALEDPNGNQRTTTFEYPDTPLGRNNYPALIAAVQENLLDGVPLTFRMLSGWADDRWRFVLFEEDRLDALETHYGEGIECFGEPLLHEQTPADFAAANAAAAVEAAPAGAGTSDSGGDIGVDESTEGWLGGGMADLSEVDLDGSDDAADVAAAVDDESEAEDEDVTGLDSIFETIEASANADTAGETGHEIESSGRTIEELLGESEPEAAEPAASAPEPSASEAVADTPAPAAEPADAATESTEPTEPTETSTPEPEPVESEPEPAAPTETPAASASESPAEPETQQDSEPAVAEPAPEPSAGAPETQPDSEPSSAESAQSPEEPAAAEPADAASVEPEPADAEPTPADSSSTASEQEPVAFSDDSEPVDAASESSPTATETSAADTSQSDDAEKQESKGIVGKILGAIRGLF